MLRLCAITLLLLLGSTAHAIAPAGSEANLVIVQSVTGPSAGANSSVTARRGTARGFGPAMSMDIGATNLGSTGVPQLMVTNYGTNKTRSQLTSIAKTNIVGISYPGAPGAIASLVSSLKTYMKNNGVGLAAFNFNQEVIVTGDATPKYLVWSMVLREGQQPVFPDPRVVDSLPVILQLVYTPKRVAKGLPSSWTYPNAGTIQWRKLDSAYSPITSWATVDVAGAYDVPEDLSGTAVNKDWGLKCLVNRSSSATCPATTNAMDIMDQTGAGYALLDYTRLLEPVYDEVENPAGSGNFEQVARASMSVDHRELNMSGCTSGTFNNRGTYGFELNNRVDRYAVWSGGEYRQLNTFTTHTMSPISNFDVTKSGLTGVTAASLADKIVNPGDPTGELLTASSLPNLLNLAPITLVSSSSPTKVIGVYYHGSCGRAFGVESQCDPQGNISLKFGISSQVASCTVGTSFYQEQNYTLRPGAATGWQMSSLDYAGNFMWRFDGVRSIVFQHVMGPTTGYAPLAPPGVSIFASQLFFPNQGYYLNQNFPSGGPLDFYFEKGICPAGTVGGETIYSTMTDGYADLVTQCFAPDIPSGPGAYYYAAPKTWAPAQQ